VTLPTIEGSRGWRGGGDAVSAAGSRSVVDTGGGDGLPVTEKEGRWRQET
jgi:hypothetical protein